MPLKTEIHLLAESNTPWPEILATLHSRSDEDCYSAYHWLENRFHDFGGLYPENAGKKGANYPAATVCSLMEFPEEVPMTVRELVALGSEYLDRQSKL